MLELKGITKVYPAGGDNVHALKGIDLRFRSSEFVSILGPSGCGKTTMLNIIGGLDQYTEGDLVINGTSTKKYKDRDWDAYRNYSVGFVFQSYNLIPHQTVLQNVELALTLSGVSKKERRERAKQALEKVGLSDQLRKRPSEMSGGQCQRVAIARAIVNNPDIILAYEPTGALDTETSVQVMDILKEISKDRLVIMVTHNPELAETYSTRIVKMLDGVIKGDSMPVSDDEWKQEDDQFEAKKQEELQANNGKKRAKKKPSMSFATSFGLSLKNLFTKKGRTMLTSFAGSIGIIGIALIYAVSNGTTAFVNSVQEETLTSYPITIEASSMDMTALLETFMGKATSISEHENDAIYQKNMVYEMLNAMNNLETKENDLKSFKAFLESEKSDPNSKLSSALSGIQYTYDTNFYVYSKNPTDGKIIIADTQQLMMDLISKFSGTDFSALMSFSNSTAMGSMMSSYQESVALWKQLLPGDNGAQVNDVTKKKYDLVYGSWPARYDEVILFVDEHNEVDDLTLYALGLKTQAEIEALMDASVTGGTIEYEERKWTYEEICNTEFRTILSSDCYTYDEMTGTYSDLRKTDTGLKFLYDNGLTLHVVGIAKPSEDSSISSNQNSSIGYTESLLHYVIEHAKESPAVKAQLADTTKDIFTGLPFKSSDDKTDAATKAAAFDKYISELDDASKAEVYVKIMSIPSEEMVAQFIEQTLAGTTMDQLKATILAQMAEQTGMDQETLAAYLDNMSDDDILALVSESMEKQFTEQYAQQVRAQFVNMTQEQLLAALDMLLSQMDNDSKANAYDNIAEFSTSTYDKNIAELGVVDIDSPASINLYATSFENKDVIEEVIAEYNEGKSDIDQITYTDMVGLLMSSVTTIINAITYVLIAFVAVSLIVSSIMIGVITLISVQERTKEIGILRAIGASKRNVSSMFNAETVIIGFTSGFIGVMITYLMCIPINLILHKLTGIQSLSARLPITVAIVLILISMFLTLIAGIIPSRSAAKKDPVVALRTE